MRDALVAHPREKKTKLLYGEAPQYTTIHNETAHSVYDVTKPSQFIDERDRMPLTLCISLYTDIVGDKDGWELQGEGTASVRVWVKDDTAIVGIMGTSQKTLLSNLHDDAKLAGVIDGACDLDVVEQAASLIENIEHPNIIVAGHSLGGAGAFCLAHRYTKIRAVSFNMGAPPTGGSVLGAGRDRCRAYHIVGDIISTHMDDSTADVSRIKLNGDVDWSNVSYYHSSDRFFESRGYTKWSAQTEQNSLVNYVYNISPGAAFASLLTGLVSSSLNIDRIREIICKNPIPGTTAGCPDLLNFGRIATTALGWVGGLYLGGPIGAVTGAKLGYDIGSGAGALDLIEPRIVNAGLGLGVRKTARYAQKYRRRIKYGV